MHYHRGRDTTGQENQECYYDSRWRDQRREEDSGDQEANKQDRSPEPANHPYESIERVSSLYELHKAMKLIQFLHPHFSVCLSLRWAYLSGTDGSTRVSIERHLSCEMSQLPLLEVKQSKASGLGGV